MGQWERTERATERITSKRMLGAEVLVRTVICPVATGADDSSLFGSSEPAKQDKTRDTRSGIIGMAKPEYYDPTNVAIFR